MIYLSTVSIRISDNDDSQGRHSCCHLLPQLFAFFIFFSIIMKGVLSLIFLVLGFGRFYFFIVFFEHFVGEIELVVDGIFPDIVGIKFVLHLFINGL